MTYKSNRHRKPIPNSGDVESWDEDLQTILEWVDTAIGTKEKAIPPALTVTASESFVRHIEPSDDLTVESTDDLVVKSGSTFLIKNVQ